MPILDIQKRARELGRIRTGQKGDRGQPQKLDRFRLTSPAKHLLDKVAELYGGTVGEWTPRGGAQQWEVITNATRIPIMVPPQPVSQWMETWSAAGCIHRCDGHTNVLTDEPCDPDDPAHRDAKPTTRLNVVLRDVEGIGVWRLESHGWNAAIELPNAAEFLAQAGGYVNGWVALEPRTSKTFDRDGKPLTRQFMVPIIEIDVTPAQLMAGHGRVAAPAISGGPVGETPALAAAGPDYVALAADMSDPEEIRNLWRQANGAGHMTQGLSEHLQKRVADLEAAGAPETGADAAPASQPAEQLPDEDGVVDAELVDDADAVWQRILTEAGRQGMSLPDVQDDFSRQMDGLIANDATSGELQVYLDKLLAGDSEPVAS